MGLFNKKKDFTATATVDKSRVLNDKTPFIVKETYKTLRTNLMFALPNDEENEGGKVIVFTSAVPGEGKTTVCLNTAITFAQTGAKVLLIDSDLRAPKIHKYLSIDGKTGFSDVLGNFCDLKSVITHIKEYDVDCIPGGQIPPNPAELLGSKTTSNVLDELKKIYDYIFIDTPPITVVTDALALAPISSGVALIAREGYTPRTAIKGSLQSLKFANARILGIINNCSNENGAGANYGFKKSFSGYTANYYQYGYDNNNQ